MTETSGVSVRARFERLPSGLKGALILRGEDANPHQVTFHDVRVVAVDGEWDGGRSVAIPASVVDVAPHKDVFVPLDCPIGDLPAGWYGFRCSVAVDGDDTVLDGGRRFAVAWPRGTVRRGAIPVAAEVPFGDGSLRIEQLDCAGDATKVPFVASPALVPEVKVLADGAPLPVLDVESDGSGRGKIVTYPLLRAHSALRLEFHGGGRRAALDIPLP